MTNDALNKYIKHYIEKDKTGRAIMLTGAWGMGKSYYIKNTLIPFLAKKENGQHQCIVVSLYGLSDLSEVSKAIYFETKTKRIKDKLESEAGRATLLVAKTVLKGLTHHFGLDLNADEKGLQDLYQSVDLTGKLIILEDVERSNINILEILGYVNSLVEQDNVKVILVTNEEEIKKYEYAEKDEKEVTQSDIIVGHKQLNNKALVKYYAKETIRYLKTKEKAIGDTIQFEGNVESAITEIINSFENEMLRQFAKEECVSDIAAIMFISDCENLRSVIFACQKTVDIYEHIENDSYSEDFLKTILYGNIAFSIRLNTGTIEKWIGLEHYSQELGIQSFPVFRFCYDYITTQQLDLSQISVADEALKKLRLYDPNKTSTDQDLRILIGFHIHNEAEVTAAIDSITQRLSNPEDISFYDYGKIASALVAVKHELGIDISHAKELLINNLKGRGSSVHGSDLFLQTVSANSTDEKFEFVKLREEMIHSLEIGKGNIPEFDYAPEQAKALYEYATKQTGLIYEAHGFTRFLDLPRFVDMYFHASPEQMNHIRSTFISLYRPENIKDQLASDLPSIAELIIELEAGQRLAHIDKIQQMQCRWFVEQLITIRNKLL